MNKQSKKIEAKPGDVVALRHTLAVKDSKFVVITNELKLAVVLEGPHVVKKVPMITVLVPKLVNKNYEYYQMDVELSLVMSIVNFDFFDKCNNTRYKDVVRGLREINKSIGHI